MKIETYELQDNVTIGRLFRALKWCIISTWHLIGYHSHILLAKVPFMNTELQLIESFASLTKSAMSTCAVSVLMLKPDSAKAIEIKYWCYDVLDMWNSIIK